MCCGNKRTATRVAGHGPSRTDRRLSGGGAVQQALSFVNLASTGFTVIAPASGRQYTFATPGAQVQADPRDRAFLARIQKLRQLG